MPLFRSFAVYRRPLTGLGREFTGLEACKQGLDPSPEHVNGLEAVNFNPERADYREESPRARVQPSGKSIKCINQ